MRRLNVWWESRRVGELTQDDSGDLGFRYDPDWVESKDASALSMSLPKRREIFSRRQCRPFFAGLLPDERQREGAARALGVSEANDFALLYRLGGDVAGALQLLPPDQPAPSLTYKPQTRALTDRELVGVLGELPARPLLAGENGLRLSLAGAQSKMPVVLVEGAIALPAPGEPTTHIIKPPIASIPATTENEAAVMRLARAAGLDVAPVEPRVVQGKSFLLIERYDRMSGANDETRRLHQEDFCQALGIPPEHKYASEGGPVFKDCFALLRRASTLPGRDVLKLLDAAIFNLIVGNADAHGKNFSLLYDPTGIRLAPLYDLLSTVQYSNLALKSAMKIGHAATLANLSEDNWRRFAKDAGIAFPYLRRRVAELSEQVRELANGVCSAAYMPGLDAQALAALAADLVRRAETIALKLPGRASRARAPKIAKGRQSIKT